MKSFFWFFIIVLALYSLINFYLILRLGRLSSRRRVLWIIRGSLLFLALCYPLSRILHTGFPELGRVFGIMGALYTGEMIYLFLLFLLTDLLMVLSRLIPKLGQKWNSSQNRRRSAWIILILAGLLNFAGWIQFYSPKVTEYELTLSGRGEPFQIAVISDLHYGNPFISDGYVKKIIALTNAQSPNLILLPGDVIDSRLSQSQGQALSLLLREFKAPEGVFAVTGNHEFYAGAQDAIQILAQGHVRVLQDQGLEAGEIFLAGRQDRDAARFGIFRKALSEILKANTAKKPVLVMDHQPRMLEEAVSNQVAAQFSGHTHHGQMFPFQWITQQVYELSRGEMKKGQTRIYVSSGVGGWGPPVRLGNSPEILLIKVRFDKEKN